MNKLFLIIQREFVTRVKKKSFILLTIFTPFIMVALVFVPMWLASIEDNEQKVVAVHDATARYIGLFHDDASYRFVPISDPNAPSYYSDTTDVEAVVDIRGDLSKDPKAVVMMSRQEIPSGLLSYVTNVLNEQVRKDKLQATGIQGLDRIIEDVQTELTIPTIKRNAEGNASSSDTNIAMMAGFLFTFLIYMFVMSYGGMVMQSVMEEKTNRIVELMVSSVKPFQLMMGKIIGIACVGFVQLAIWGVMIVILMFGAASLFGLSVGDSQQLAMGANVGIGAAGPDMAATMAATSDSQQMLNAILNLPFAELTVCFVLYFVGGYLLYASFFAAVGASVNEQEDSSQFLMPMMLIMVFGLYAALGSAENTNGPLAMWTSIIPLTSPIVMMVRIPFGVPMWQEILSLGILYGTALLFVWLSGRIYRVGILMYGKKPTIKELVKWIRYK